MPIPWINICGKWRHLFIYDVLCSTILSWYLHLWILGLRRSYFILSDKYHDILKASIFILHAYIIIRDVIKIEIIKYKVQNDYTHFKILWTRFRFVDDYWIFHNSKYFLCWQFLEIGSGHLQLHNARWHIYFKQTTWTVCLKGVTLFTGSTFTLS